MYVQRLLKFAPTVNSCCCMMSSHFIDSAFVKENVKYDDLIPAIKGALSSFSNRDETKVDQPVRTMVSAKKNNGNYYVMPVYSADEDVFVTKIVSRYPDNPSRRLSTHNSVIWLFDGATGILKATIEGDQVTDRRTAAASAVATQLLAPENSKIHTILGAGALAESHLEALSTVCDFEEVRVWNHNHPRAEKFAELHGCKAFQSAEEAVRGADVITTVTMASTPVVSHDWVKEGAHINAVGAPLPTRQEIDPALMRSSVLYVDSREGAVKEAGDIILSKADIYAEIGEVILGKAEARRKETTVFKSLGMAMEDLVAAKIIYDKFQQSLGEQS